jgi:hypothetical protein
MPTKVTFLLTFTWTILAMITFSHCGPPCDIEPGILERSNWKLIELNNSGVEPNIEYGNSGSKESFGLRLQFEMSGSRGSECPENYYENLNPVIEFSISAEQDFDQTHPAGALLNDYFVVRSINTLSKLPEYKAISTTIDIFNKFTVSYVEVDYILVHPPEYLGAYQFNVKLRFSNSESTTVSSRLFTLK